ncbi:MAG TPA: TonB-dependent receptor plug domain-containing protein [Opitutaceae bacterium]
MITSNQPTFAFRPRSRRALAVLGLNFLLAASLSHGQSVQSPETAATAASEEDGDVIELAAFTVMSGTNIRGVEQSTGSVVIGMTRADIQATGPATTEELLKVNPAMGNFQALFPGNGDAGGSYLPSIHGLGEGQTLVLINGHRLPGSGWLATGADPSAIPPSAL